MLAVRMDNIVSYLTRSDLTSWEQHLKPLWWNLHASTGSDVFAHLYGRMSARVLLQI